MYNLCFFIYISKVIDEIIIEINLCSFNMLFICRINIILYYFGI